MPLTKVACGMLKDECVDALRDSFAFTFDDDAARDSFFSKNTNLLENDGSVSTLAFIGTTSLKYAFWNGASKPSVYDNSGWTEITVAATQQVADVHYWGDPNVDKTMRARRDPSNGFLIFERRVSGSWVEKFRISDSVAVDTLKLIEADKEPVVNQGELGLYNVKFLDSERGNIEVLRPIFTGSAGTHFPVVAGMPDGSLRIPNNIDAALADPKGTPLTYNHVFTEKNPDKLIQTINAYTGPEKIDVSRIKGLAPTGPLTGAEIVQAIKDDQTTPKVPFANVEGAAPSSLTQQVTTHEQEINRLKTDVSSSALPVYTYHDKGVPTLPTDQHRAFYVHITVLPDSAQAINIPAGMPEDAILSIENNDRTDYLTLRAAPGETVNKVQAYQCGFDTLNLFVKSGTDWTLAYGGIFPNSMDALKSSVQVLLSGQLHTIDELTAQFKDQLHTFREIGEHFSDKLFTRAQGLPTSAEIVSIMQSGSDKIPYDNLESVEKIVKYDVADDTPATIDGTATLIILDFDLSASVTQTLPPLSGVHYGARLYAYAHSAVQAGEVLTLEADGSDTIDGSATYDIDEDNKALFAADTKNKEWVLVTADDVSGAGGGGSDLGINIDDGTSDVADVKRINIKGMKITEIPNQGGMGANEAEMTAGVNIHMMAPDQQYGSALANEITVLPPLNVYDDPDVTDAEGVKLEIKPGTFEPMHKPSFLAYLKENEDVVGKIPQGFENTAGSHHHGSIWFDDIIVPAGAYIETKMAEKSYGIQEADELDPNVSGGTDYLIAARVHMKGNAPSAGFVRLYLYNSSIDPFNPTGYLLDVEGQPMAVERHYKTTEELGVLDIIGIVNAKGLQEFTVHVVDSFTDDVIELTDRGEGASGIMIQAVTSEEKTGLALLQFENDTNQNIEFNGHYLGPARMNLGFIAARPDPVVSYTAGTNWVSVDGWRLINPRGLKVGAVDGHVQIQDDGVHICDFNFGKVFSAEETRMLRNKQVDLTVTLIDKNAGFTVALMKWTGKPDEFTPEIFTTRDGGGSPEFQTNWTRVDTLFISEDIVVGDHTLTKTFTVPNDANNYAIILYPVEAQDPITLKLKGFKLDVKTPFNGYIINAPEMLNELHLKLSDTHKRFVQDTQGYAGLRYTINNAANGLPMPAGIPKSGTAPIELDTSVNQVPGSSAKGGEGALKFTEDGRAKISTIVRVWNEQGTDNTATFWWAEVSPDGNTYTKLVDSEFTVNVPANSKGVVHKFVYSHDFEKDDRIALRASANKADGAFIDCVSDSRPMVDTAIDFEMLVADSGDDPELVSAPYDRKLVTDNRVIPFSGVTTQNFEFDIDIPADVEIGSHSVVGTLGGNVVSIDNSEFSYNPNTHKMTVHVGTFTEGKIYLTLWG